MKYNKEFKAEALKLSDEIGVKKAAQQLGLAYYTLADWRKDRKADVRLVGDGDRAEEVRERIRALEKENAKLRKANEILADALGFFVKDRKKYEYRSGICISKKTPANIP